MKKSPRKVGLLTCIFLVAATMVGNGIYTSLGMQLTTISCGFTILALWGLGGLCALCGALSYAELAAQMPHSGGEYYYFSKIYHPALGMMAGIVAQIAGCIGPIALASMAFGTYFQALCPQINPLYSSVLLVTLVTLFHLVNLGVSAVFQDLTTGLKFLLIGFLCYLGFRYAVSPLAILLPSKLAFKELWQPSSGVTLLFCYYSYSGWNAATYIADEVMTSQKTVGRSLIIGTLLVTVVYLVMNTVFLMAAPVEELRGVLDVGRVVATHLLGPQGGRILSLLIAVGLVASVSAMTIIGPRIMEMMGKDLSVLRWFGQVSKENIPIRATLFQYVMVLVLLVTSSFKIVLVSTQFAIISCELLGVLSVMMLRRKNAASRIKATGFQCPFYPLPQLFFALVSIMALVYTAVTNWLEALPGVGLIVVSLLAYTLIQRKTDHRYSI
ncbi:MAG: amino acid permease [Chthoniobacterales bacterium]|nr:amino acid permease [Chthoniobacterales bacterium]